MSKYTTIWYKIYHWFAQIPAKISFSRRNYISQEQKNEIAKCLASGYYIILTGDRHHFSSIVVSFLSWVKTGQWAKYTHALMNCDNITDANDFNSFKFVEATSVGVHLSSFDQVFSCDYVCLLSPVNVSNIEWTQIIDKLLSQQGLKYDDLFDLSDSSRVSCVELVLNALKATKYSEKFKDLESLINQEKNLVPQMFRNCKDLVVTLEK